MGIFDLAEQLKSPYREVFERAQIYSTIENIPDQEAEEALLNLYDLLFTAQEEGKPILKLVGPDMGVFFKHYFEERKIGQKLANWPEVIYFLVRNLLILEAIFLVGDLIAGQVTANEDIYFYLVGIFLSLLTIPLGHLTYYSLLRIGKLRTSVFYPIVLAIFLFLLSLFLWVNPALPIMVPRYWVMGMGVLYLVAYKIYNLYKNQKRFGQWQNPNRRANKEFLTSTKKNSQYLRMKNEFYKTMARRYKKWEMKGKKSEAYFLREEKWMGRDKMLLKWGLFLVPLVSLPFAIPVFLSDPLQDALIFLAIEWIFVGLIVLGIQKLISFGLPARQEILKEMKHYKENLATFFHEKQ